MNVFPEMKAFSKLLGSLLLLASPFPALAESQDQVYLVVFGGAQDTSRVPAYSIASVLIPMRDMDSCHAAGVKLMGNNKEGGNIQGKIHFFRVGYDCVNGVKQ